MRRFLLDAGWILGLRIVNVPLQFLLFALVARLHALEVVGVYAVFFAAWALARQLSPLGLDHAANRFIPLFLADGRDGAARRFERQARLWVFTLTGLVTAGVALLVLLAQQVDLLRLDSAALLSGAAAAPGFALVALLAAQLRARGRPRAAVAPDALLVPTAAGAVLLVCYQAFGPTLTGLLASHAVAVWLAVAVYLLLARRLGRAAADQLHAEDRRAIRAIRAIRAMAMAVTVAGAANALAIQLPVLLIGGSLGAAAAGLYEAARRFAQLGTLTTWAASTAVAPLLADAHARCRQGQLQTLLAVSSWAAFLPALAILVLLVVAGQPLLSLFGPGYVAAWPVMLLLAGFTAVNASGGLSSTALNMTGHADVVLRFSVMQLAVVVAAVPALGQLWGLEGAALAVLLGGLLRDGGLSVLLPRYVELVPGVWSLRGTRLAWRALAHRRDGDAATA